MVKLIFKLLLLAILVFLSFILCYLITSTAVTFEMRGCSNGCGDFQTFCDCIYYYFLGNKISTTTATFVKITPFLLGIFIAILGFKKLFLKQNEKNTKK